MFDIEAQPNIYGGHALFYIKRDDHNKSVSLKTCYTEN
jgi:hypothetical protein